MHLSSTPVDMLKTPMTTHDPRPFFEMQDIKKKAEGKKEIVDLRPLNGGFKIFKESPHTMEIKRRKKSSHAMSSPITR